MPEKNNYIFTRRKTEKNILREVLRLLHVHAHTKNLLFFGNWHELNTYVYLNNCEILFVFKSKVQINYKPLDKKKEKRIKHEFMT